MPLTRTTALLRNSNHTGTAATSFFRSASSPFSSSTSSFSSFNNLGKTRALLGATTQNHRWQLSASSSCSSSSLPASSSFFEGRRGFVGKSSTPTSSPHLQTAPAAADAAAPASAPPTLRLELREPTNPERVATTPTAAPETASSDDTHAVVSTFDLFSIGVGPSSSHTVGPMRAARKFVARLKEIGLMEEVAKVKVELYGSLACTGEGHATPQALLMGLEGETPEDVVPESINLRVDAIKRDKVLRLLGRRVIPFDYPKDLVWRPREVLPLHSNGMRFWAFDKNTDILDVAVYYSIGGGFVTLDTPSPVNAYVRVPDADGPKGSEHGPGVETWKEARNTEEAENVSVQPYQPIFPFRTCKDLLDICAANKASIAEVVMANECVWRSKEKVKAEVLKIWKVMDNCILRGCTSQETHLPGSIRAKRRAPALYQKLVANEKKIHNGERPNGNITRDSRDQKLDWLSCFAIAVNEENAAGGRVVTAPTNGAAGIIPAVLKYYTKFVDGTNEDGIVDFLLTASAVGQLIKRGASISAAEVGCQGEVGVACSMAAAGLAAVMGGTVEQVENAAEIGLEHNLGLTCDPIAGLVQIPCIERNAMGSAKAVAAARLALSGDGKHVVSLDSAIATMRNTGRDMMAKYKETSEGGLAVHVALPEC